MSVPSYVRESVSDLERLAAQFRNQPQEKRVRALLLLKSDPTASFSQIAGQLRCSPGTISRWVSLYKSEGMEGLLRLPGSSPKSGPVDPPPPAPADRSGIPLSSAPDKAIREQVWRIQDRVIEFLHAFPVDADAGIWGSEVRDILQSEFNDVDRITININTNCDLLHPDEYHPRLAIAQDAYPEAYHKGLSVSRLKDPEADVAQDLIREFERRGYPVDQYHPPFIMNLEYRGAYLGTVFLWRERSAPPISERTIAVVSRLEQFFVFAMSDMILRHHYMAPVERAFYYTLGEVSEQASLTPQEYRVMTYRLLGYMYKEIAAELNISQDAVKKTLQQIYRKTETGSHIEFFAKYFAARIVPPRSTTQQRGV